jgi:uncharacterized protein (TIGR03000 family)
VYNYGTASTYVPPVINNTYTYVPPATTTYQSSYYSPDTAASNNTALLSVSVPTADAEVWVQSTLTQQTGTVRQFTSPPLTPGRNYTYRVTARWRANGQTVVQARDVSVSAGAQAVVDFNRPVGS